MGTKQAKRPPLSARSNGGRPTSYRPEFAEQATKLCELGATVYDLAQFFKVAVSTIQLWRTTIPEFSTASKVGKAESDDRVEMSLYHRAVGYTYESEKVFCHQGEIIRAPIVEHVPPDVGAANQWLKNRRPDVWRERQEPTNINLTLTLADLVNMSYRPDIPELPAPGVIDHEDGTKNS